MPMRISCILFPWTYCYTFFLQLKVESYGRGKIQKHRGKPPLWKNEEGRNTLRGHPPLQLSLVSGDRNLPLQQFLVLGDRMRSYHWDTYLDTCMSGSIFSLDHLAVFCLCPANASLAIVPLPIIQWAAAEWASHDVTCPTHCVAVCITVRCVVQ